jgi:surface protein
MSKINEQIQRLRDVLVTCYNAIKRKGGTIPEAGERNMSNLPDAVRSIPQEHTELTELTVTANREYLPAEYDADGFSKVTARFDTSSLPKVKVTSFKVTNDCINENGYWEAELVDVSQATTLCEAFLGDNKLQKLDVSGWNTINVTNFNRIFSGCVNLRMLDLKNWHLNSSALTLEMFFQCQNLISLIGETTLEEVITNKISCLNGLRTANMYFMYNAPNINRASLIALFNGLADLSGQDGQTLTFHSSTKARLTEEDIAIATNKNWSIS